MHKPLEKWDTFVNKSVSWRKRIRNDLKAIHRCSEVHEEDQSMTLNVDGGSKTTCMVMERHIACVTLTDYTCKDVMQLERSGGEGVRARIQKSFRNYCPIFVYN